MIVRRGHGDWRVADRLCDWRCWKAIPCRWSNALDDDLGLDRWVSYSTTGIEGRVAERNT